MSSYSPDPTPNPVPVTGTTDVHTVGLSPKMIVGTATVTVLSFVLALLNAVNTPDGAKLLGSLPPVWQFILLLAVAPLVTAFTTYKAAAGKIAAGPPPTA